RKQAAAGKGGTDNRRDRADLGVDQQQKAIDDIADSDHSLDLTALSCAAQKRLGRRLPAHAFQTIRSWIEEGQSDGVHDLAIGGTSEKNLRGKAFRFGIFLPECSATGGSALCLVWKLPASGSARAPSSSCLSACRVRRIMPATGKPARTCQAGPKEL